FRLDHLANLGDYPPPHLLRLDPGLEELAPKVGDDRLMNLVLELGEGIAESIVLRPASGEPLVQVHQERLPGISRRRRRCGPWPLEDSVSASAPSPLTSPPPEPTSSGAAPT